MAIRFTRTTMPAFALVLGLAAGVLLHAIARRAHETKERRAISGN